VWSGDAGRDAAAAVAECMWCKLNMQECTLTSKQLWVHCNHSALHDVYDAILKQQ